MSDQFQRNPTALFADIDSDIVALNVELGRGYGLEGVTATVWTLLDQPQSLDNLCEALMRDYDVDEATCRADVGELLDELVREDLVRRF